MHMLTYLMICVFCISYSASNQQHVDIAQMLQILEEPEAPDSVTVAPTAVAYVGQVFTFQLPQHFPTPFLYHHGDLPSWLYTNHTTLAGVPTSRDAGAVLELYGVSAYPTAHYNGTRVTQKYQSDGVELVTIYMKQDTHRAPTLGLHAWPTGEREQGVVCEQQAYVTFASITLDTHTEKHADHKTQLLHKLATHLDLAVSNLELHSETRSMSHTDNSVLLAGPGNVVESRCSTDCLAVRLVLGCGDVKPDKLALMERIEADAASSALARVVGCGVQGWVVYLEPPHKPQQQPQQPHRMRRQAPVVRATPVLIPAAPQPTAAYVASVVDDVEEPDIIASEEQYMEQTISIEPEPKSTTIPEPTASVTLGPVALTVPEPVATPAFHQNSWISQIHMMSSLNYDDIHSAIQATNVFSAPPSTMVYPDLDSDNNADANMHAASTPTLDMNDMNQVYVEPSYLSELAGDPSSYQATPALEIDMSSTEVVYQHTISIYTEHQNAASTSLVYHSSTVLPMLSSPVVVPMVSSTPVIPIVPSDAALETSTITIPNSSPVLAQTFQVPTVYVGTSFMFAIPVETFWDDEDGDTFDLTLTLDHEDFVQLVTEVVELSIVPAIADIGLHWYTITATDSRGASVHYTFSVSVAVREDSTLVAGKFSTTLNIDYQEFKSDQGLQDEFKSCIARMFGASDPTEVVILNIREGSTIVDWTLLSAVSGTFDGCPQDVLQNITAALYTSTGQLKDGVLNNVEAQRLGVQGIDFIPTGTCSHLDLNKLHAQPAQTTVGQIAHSATAPKPTAIQDVTEVLVNEEIIDASDSPVIGQNIIEDDDAFGGLLIPIILIVSMVALAIIIAVLLHRKRRQIEARRAMKGSHLYGAAESIQPQQPVIFNHELAASQPLINGDSNRKSAPKDFDVSTLSRQFNHVGDERGPAPRYNSFKPKKCVRDLKSDSSYQDDTNV